ncbi:MAG: hypothetical protein R3Y24_13010, partial [Eubacteriales bacterium]
NYYSKNTTILQVKIVVFSVFMLLFFYQKEIEYEKDGKLALINWLISAVLPIRRRPYTTAN